MRVAYIPQPVEYAAPWVLGVAISLALGIMGVPPLAPKLDAIAATSVASKGVTVVALALLNFLLLYISARGSYLTFALAWRPLLGTLAALCVLYVGAFGAVAWMRGEAKPTLSAATDWNYTLYIVAAGLSLLLPFLTLSAFHKPNGSATPALLAARRFAVSVLERLETGDRGEVSRIEVRDLSRALERVVAESAAVRWSLQTPADRLLLDRWSTAAQRLLDHRVGSLSPGEVRSIPELADRRTELASSRPPSD